MWGNIKPKSNKKGIIKIILKILYQILVILCLIVAAVIIMQKVTANNKSIAGYRMFRVITGSMEPEYDVGEVVISKEIDPKKIKVGDDIVYLGKYGDYNGKIIMHSVVGIDTDANGNLNFHAKGLHSSSVEDPQVKTDQIYGVVKYQSDILTILYKLATNIYSVFVIIIVLSLNVFISFRSPRKKKKIQKLNEASEYIDYAEDEDEIEDEDEDEEDDDDEYEEDEDNDDDEYEEDEEIEDDDDTEEE